MGSHYSPFAVWAKVRCQEKGWDFENLSTEQKRALREEFYRQNPSPDEKPDPKHFQI